MKRRRDPGPQAHANSAVIVMEDPVVENVLQMPLSQGDQEVQAFSANRSDQTFANRICFGLGSHRCGHDSSSEHCRVRPIHRHLKKSNAIRDLQVAADHAC